MKKPKVDYKRAAWMQRYSEKAAEVNPESAGRLDWYTAENAYARGQNPEEAAILIVGMGIGVRPETIFDRKSRS